MGNWSHGCAWCQTTDVGKKLLSLLSGFIFQWDHIKNSLLAEATPRSAPSPLALLPSLPPTKNSISMQPVNKRPMVQVHNVAQSPQLQHKCHSWGWGGGSMGEVSLVQA